jgi:peptidoglycan/LPS O-acetylase OafA/YrhL
MNLLLNNLHPVREIKIPVDLSWVRVVKSYLFIPIENKGLYNEPVVFLGWSLNFEMLFYLLTFLCLRMFRKKFYWPLLSLMIGLSLVGFLAKGFTDIYLDFFTSPFLLYFSVGLLVGKYQEYLVKKVAPFAEHLFFISVYILFVVMFAKDSGYEFTGIAREIVIYNEKSISRIFIWGIPSLLFFISYFSLAEKYNIRSSYLNKLGDRSYSIYLLQVFFIYLLMEISSMINRYEKIVLSMIFIVILVWISGFSFRYFEKRFHQ